MNGSAADITGFLGRTDGVDGDSECLQSLKGDHRLIVFDVVTQYHQHSALLRHFFSLFLGFSEREGEREVKLGGLNCESR